MRVFNEDKTKELTEYDIEKGYLKEDVLITHIEEVQAVEEVGHYEVIAEYQNGGKDVQWVVDKEGIKYQPAKDEKEEILVYIQYTEEELAKVKAQARIFELKTLLKETDYRAIKYAEGQYTFQEYQPYLIQRKSWRDEINRLEAEITNIK